MMFNGLPKAVRVYEVGPRDGLQNEKAFVVTEDKVALVERLIAAGLKHIEVTSFVHPRWIPALADAERVAAQLAHRIEEISLSALVPNERGLDRALAAGLQEIAVFMSASETHNQRNINKNHKETMAAFRPVFARCADAGVRVRAYLSTVWGCPYEGQVDLEVSVGLARSLLSMGAYQVSLGDTIGIGNPLQTDHILQAMLSAIPADALAMHMHDTRGSALANCTVALARGITTFDSSIGGLGGCPYAPGASGNLATEDLVYMLHSMGIETGVDLEQLIAAGQLAEQFLGRPLPGRALQALNACANPGKTPQT